MLPVAIGWGEGADFYRPLGIAIIGGMITSTVLTLLVVPTFYDSIQTRGDRILAWFKRRAHIGEVVPVSMAPGPDSPALIPRSEGSG